MKVAAAAALLAIAASLAACGPSSSSSASAPATTAKASAAPKAAAVAAGTVSPLAACGALAAWENGNASDQVENDPTLRQTFEDTTQPLSGDFATWTADIRADPSLDGVNADKVGSDCAAWNVTIFPSDSDSAAPATTAPAAPVTSAPPAAPAGNTVATFSGSGIENTAKFTVTDTWKLDYSFD